MLRGIELELICKMAETGEDKVLGAIHGWHALQHAHNIVAILCIGLANSWFLALFRQRVGDCLRSTMSQFPSLLYLCGPWGQPTVQHHCMNVSVTCAFFNLRHFDHLFACLWDGFVGCGAYLCLECGAQANRDCTVGMVHLTWLWLFMVGDGGGFSCRSAKMAGGCHCGVLHLWPALAD